MGPDKNLTKTPHDLKARLPAANQRMIIKIGQKVSQLRSFTAKDHTVKARRMREPFTYETGKGWAFGESGDWLLLIDNSLWVAVEDKQFRSIYKELVEDTECPSVPDSVGGDHE